MKGVLKGFKYITQIFDEEKEKEMQIGLPTDVKHLAHIGLDGPSSESPSWMNKFKGQEKAQSGPLDTNKEPVVQQRARSAPLDANGNLIDSSSQDTSRDMLNIPKASRRRYSADNLTIETKDLSSKSKGSRRHRRKDSSDGSINKSGRRRHQRKDSGPSDHEGSSSRSGRRTGFESASQLPSPSSPTPRNLPDIPKSSRRKKPKDESSKLSKSKASSNNESNQISSSLNPSLVEEEKREIVGCPEGSA